MGPSDPMAMGGRKVKDLYKIPNFPRSESLRYALDMDEGGLVQTGGPCGGVALQRAWCLLHNGVPNGSIWRKVGRTSVFFFGESHGAVIASDLVDWCRKDGLQADHIDKWSDAISHLRQGRVVLTILNAQHWVTVVGVSEGVVYVLDYGGLYAVDERTFASNVRCVPIFAPGAMIWVSSRRQ